MGLFNMGTKRPCPRCKKAHRDCTPKRRRFAELYVIYLDGAKAARGANYSKNSARQIGLELLHDDAVQCVIQELVAERSRRTQVQGDDILLGLLRIARFNPKDIFNDDGSMKKLSDIPDEIAEAIAGMKFKDGKLEELKLPDKVRSYELLGKHKRLFADVHVVEGEMTIKERIARGRQRRKKES